MRNLTMAHCTQTVISFSIRRMRVLSSRPGWNFVYILLLCYRISLLLAHLTNAIQNDTMEAWQWLLKWFNSSCCSSILNTILYSTFAWAHTYEISILTIKFKKKSYLVVVIINIIYLFSLRQHLCSFSPAWVKMFCHGRVKTQFLKVFFHIYG